MQDQWQAQIQLKADVHLFAGGLSDAQIVQSLLTPCSDIAATVCVRTPRQ